MTLTVTYLQWLKKSNHPCPVISDHVLRVIPQVRLELR